MNIFKKKVHPDKRLLAEIETLGKQIARQVEMLSACAIDKEKLQHANHKLQSQVNKLSNELAEIHQAKALVASLKLIREYLIKDTPNQDLVNILNQQRLSELQLSGVQRQQSLASLLGPNPLDLLR